MHGKQRQVEPAHTTTSLPWADWAQQYDRIVWLRIVAHGIDPERASEIKQEVWELLFRRYQRGALGEVTMPGLALAQADFLAGSERRLKRTQDIGLQPNEQTVDAKQFEPEHVAIQRARLRRVASVVGASSKTTQRVFELHYSPPCLSTFEIAVRLNITEQRVRQVICELRERLRRFT